MMTQMKPTVEWMKDNFSQFNKKYFNNLLPEPKFSTSCPTGNWGYYDVRGKYDKASRKMLKLDGPGTICLTSAYSRNEHDVQETLLHEMIHEYIYQVMKLYPKNQHGELFNNIANRINKQGGYNISEKTEVKSTDTLEGNDSHAQNSAPSPTALLCIFESGLQNPKLWACKSDFDGMTGTLHRINQVGGRNAHFYQTKSANLYKMPSTPQNLWGYGGNTYEGLISEIAKNLQENPQIFSKENMTEIKL